MIIMPPRITYYTRILFTFSGGLKWEKEKQTLNYGL